MATNNESNLRIDRITRIVSVGEFVAPDGLWKIGKPCADCRV